MSKEKTRGTPDFDAVQARKIFLTVGLLGAGLVTAAAIGWVMVRRKELLAEPEADFYSMLGIGA